MHLRILVSIAALISVGWGVFKLEITEDASAAMLPADSGWQESYQQYLEAFPGDHVATVVATDLACSQQGWEIMRELHDALSQSSVIRKVSSVVGPSTKVVRFNSEMIYFDALTDLEFSNSQERCDFISNYPPFGDVLYSKTQNKAVFVAFAHPDVDAVLLSDSVRQIVESHQLDASRAGGRFDLTGEPVMSAEVARLIGEDSKFIALTFLVMLTVMFIHTRSIYPVLAALLLNLWVLIAVYGTMGWMEIRVTPATTLTVFLLVPISSAFVIHAYAYQCRLNEHARVQSRTAFLFAAISTCIGFAATGFTPAPDIQNMAIMGVVGIAVAALGVFLFVFPILALSGTKSLSGPSRIALSILRNPLPGYVFLGVLIVYSVVGLFSLQFNYSPTSAIPPDNDVRSVYDETSRSFGSLAIPIVISLEDLNSVEEWEKVVALVETVVSPQLGEVKTHWVVPQLTELTKAFTSGEKGEQLEFPDSDEGLSQLLLLFSDDDIALHLNRETKQAQVIFQVPFEGSAEYLPFKERILKSIEDQFLDARITGRVDSFFEAGHRVGLDTLKGLVGSSILIFCLMWYLFRSLLLAVSGIMVNLLPVLVGLATLGLFSIPVEMGSAIVAAIAFGLLLDDSMHLMVRVKDHVQRGYDPSTSVFQAVGELARPITATSLTIAAGFAVLFFAELQTFADFALVILVTLVTALGADLLVLPLLVRQFYRDPVK